MSPQTPNPQMARQVQALYNYNVGQKTAAGKLILIVLLFSPFIGLVIGLLASARHALGW